MSASPRIAALAAIAAFLLPLAPQAVAQTPPDPPAVISPLKVEPDRNAVNLATGKINMDLPTLSVPAAPRLRFDRVQNAAPYMRGTIIVGTPSSSSFSVHTDGTSSESFKCIESDCTSVTESGSTYTVLVNGKQGRYRRAGSGELYRFNLNSSDSTAAGKRTVQSYASQITYADGEVITFTYQTLLFNGVTYHRPTRVETNVGYFVTISYQSGVFGTNGWSMPLVAALYGTAAPSTALQSQSYSADGTTITDIGGRVWQITGAANQLGVNVESIQGTTQLPTEGSNALTMGIAGNAPLVGSAVRDGVTWSYAYTNPTANPYTSGSYYYSNVTVTGPNGYSMSYAMDPAYQNQFNGYLNIIDRSTDALGRQTNYDYDDGTRLTKVTLPEGNFVQLAYDGSGNITLKTSVAKAGSGLANIVESAVYPDSTTCVGIGVLCYRPNSYTDGLSRVTNYSWNSGGQLTQQLDPANAAGVRRETDVTYTLTGTLSRKTLVRVCGATTTCAGNADGRTEYTYWNNTFLPLTVTQKDEATGTTRTTSYAYDSAGRVLSVQGPMNGANGTKYVRYDVYGRKTWEIGAADANGLRIARRFTYRDADDKVTRVETGTIPDPGSSTLTLLEQGDTTYDSRRYPIREATSASATNYRVTDRSFLDRGLADCAAVRMNLAALPAPTSTSACTLGTQGSQGPDRIAKNLYDNAGQLLKIQKAFGTAIQQDYVTYAYTNNGKQQFVTDANGNKAQFTYDGHDRLAKWNFPSPTTPGTVSATDYEQYGYDAAGNRLSLRRRDGRTLTFTYDNLNRMLSKLIPDGCPPIQPPGTGCPAAAATRDVFTGYDLLGRQLTARFDSQAGADGITNSYDGFGNLASSTVSMAGFSKAVSALYDADNNRTRVTHPDAQAFTYAYDTRDRLTGVYEGIGTGTPLDTFAYNVDGTLGSRSEAGTGAGSAAYGYDPIGRLTSQSDAFPSSPASNVAWTFGLSPASQITAETRTNDAYAFTPIASANKAYAVNGLNQYTAVAGTGHSYDANGNLTADGTNAYIYDGENRLVSATAAGVTATLTYDPLGRLWQVIKGAANTRFLYDGDALVGEYDSAGTLTNRYVHGSNAAADDPLLWYVGAGLTTKRYLHADHLGSVVAATNASGAPSVNAYDEYGVPGSANVGRFQYTGQIWLAELGLYHYKARLYSPTLGRFLQTDPIGYDDQINLYAYVGNDPVNGTDQSGMASDCTGSRICNGDGLASGVSGSSDVSPTGRASLYVGLNGQVQDRPTSELPLEGDTAMTRAMSRDIRDFMARRISKEELQERANARAGGIAAGAVLLAGGWRLLPRMMPQISRAQLVQLGERLFGRRGVGILNSNRFLRIGWGPGAKATRTRFYEQFRIAIGNEKSIHYHIDLPWTRIP